MLRFKPKVKETLSVPVRYLLSFLIVGLCLTICVYLYSWAQNMALNATPAWHISTLLHSAYMVLLPASIVSLMFSIVMIRTDRGHPLPLFLALWMSFVAVYLVSLSLLASYSPLTPAEPLTVVLPQRIHAYSAGAVYIESTPPEGSMAVVLRPEAEPRLLAGRITPGEGNSLRIGANEFLQLPRNPFFQAGLSSPGIVDQIFTDYRVVGTFFAYLTAASRNSLLTNIGAFGLFLTSLWIYNRFTRWRLINTLVLFFLANLSVQVMALLLSSEAQQLAESFFPQTDIPALLPLLFGGGAGLLILVDLFLVPFRPTPRPHGSSGGRR